MGQVSLVPVTLVSLSSVPNVPAKLTRAQLRRHIGGYFGMAAKKKNMLIRNLSRDMHEANFHSSEGSIGKTNHETP